MTYDGERANLELLVLLVELVEQEVDRLVAEALAQHGETAQHLVVVLHRHRLTVVRRLAHLSIKCHLPYTSLLKARAAIC